MPALLPGAREAALIWNLPKLKQFGKIGHKGDGVIVYACMLCALTFICRDTNGQQGVEDASNNVHSEMAMHATYISVYVP